MSRRLILLNVVLAAAAGWLAMALRDNWREAEQRERRVMQSRPKPLPRPAVPFNAPAPPAIPSTYIGVAEKMLFSADRSSTVILDPVVVKEIPVPPFPVAHGVMIFGDVPPTVILSEKKGGEQGNYRAGDKIGPFTIASIDGEKVVFSWSGKEFPKLLADLEDHSEAPAAQLRETAAATPAPLVRDLGGAPSPGPEARSLSTEDSGLGADMGGGFRACVADDNTPDGAVRNGLKKVIGNSPFGAGGKSCHWEPAR